MSQYLSNLDNGRLNFYLNETNAESSNSMGDCTNNPDVSHDISQAIHKSTAIEMNTYVQLEMDNNNYACIPRVCRFCVSKITLNSENSSVILGVKLDASKRSIRTVDITLRNNSADLNLNYNIAYPHFLKKDTNFIYFYVQKRKKLKNRTILGFKTLAFTAIDLASILQKPFSNDMPLFYFNTKIPTILNNTNLQNLTTSTDSQHIIGSLKILSLTSTPLDSIDLDNNFHFNRTNSILNKQNIENGEELLDDYEIENIENMKDDLKSGFISESDLENETLKSKLDKNTSNQNPKNFTSKIMSFIKKLRNENLMANNDIGQNDDVEEDEEGEYDYDYDSIEQVSDYDNSDSDDSKADLYSIVSTRKPKLEPFFKNNSNPDLRSLNSNNFLYKIKAEIPENKVDKTVFMSLDSTVPKKSLKKNRSSSLNNSFQDKNSANVSKLLTDATSKTIPEKPIKPHTETCTFFLIENEKLKSLIETRLNQQASNFFIDLKGDIEILLELITKLNLTNNGLELVIIGSDLFFNDFLKSYIKFLKFHAKILNIFFIPSFRSESTVADILAKFSFSYSSLFTDSFWTNLASFELMENSDKVLNRIVNYLETCRSNQYKKLTFQIGQININDDLEKSVPFIADIKIDSVQEAIKGLNERKSLLSTSNSLPQFFNTITASNSLLLNANPSVDSSYLTSFDTENELEMQLDYWRMERVSTAMTNSQNYNSDEYSAVNKEFVTSKSKIKKRSITGQFQSILIYRKPITYEPQNKNKNFDKFLGKNFQSSINCAKSHGSSSNVNKINQEFLSLDYVLKEKKQKMRLTTRKSSVKTNHKEINKISQLNLKQLDSKLFTIRLDGIEIKNVNSFEVSCDYENKYFQLYIIIP